ncbi:MAG: polysaccharide pyruvyl transferase family protein [Microvirga sp.]
MERTVGLTAATLTGNHGAEAMLSAVIGRLRERNPDVRFIIFSYYPGADRKVLTAPDATIVSSTPARLLGAHLPGALVGSLLPRRLRRGSPLMPRDMRLLSECSVLVDLAGVAFIDGREKFLPFNILTIGPAMLLGVPVVKAAQASGPFRNWINRVSARFMLGRCAAVHARGARTYEHLRTLGIANAAPAADVAFLLQDGDRLVKPDEAMVARIGREIEAMRREGRRIVGICPSSVVYGKAGPAYLDAFADLVQRIEAAGHGVVMFPNATRAGDRDGLRNNDLPVIRRLVDALAARGSANARAVVDGDIDAVSIKEIIARCDVTIVSRFHAMVGSLSLAKPTVVFGWSHKYAEVMGDFGMEQWVFDYTRLEIDEMFPGIARLILEHESAGARIAERLGAVRASAGIQIAAIQSILDAAAP